LRSNNLPLQSNNLPLRGLLVAFLGLSAILGLLAVGCSSENPQSATPATIPPVSADVSPVLPPVLSVTLATTTPGEPPPPSVLVGAVMSKTGWLQVVDAAALAAIQAQVEIVNEAGGINGLPLRLEVIDIASDLNESFQGGKRMAGDQAAAVFVSCDQEFALPAVQETLNSIVTVIPCPVSQWWQRDNVFTFGVSPATEGRALAAQVQNTQARSAVVFSDRDSGFSEDVCQQFVQTFQGSGGMVRQVVPISFASSPSQFRTVVQQSSLAQVDVVVICSVLPTGRNLYNAIRSQGILTPVVANSQLEGDWMEADRRQGAIGVLSYGSVWGDDPAEAVNRLIQRIRQNEPDLRLNGTAIAAADALMAFVVAARQVAASSPDFQATGKLDNVELRRAIQSLENVELVSGFVSVDGDSNIVASRPMRVVEAANNVPPRTIAIVQAR